MSSKHDIYYYYYYYYYYYCYIPTFADYVTMPAAVAVRTLQFH